MKFHSRSTGPAFTRIPNARSLYLVATLTTLALLALAAFAAPPAPPPNDAAFEQKVKPFFKQNCLQCHSTETAMAGVRVDQLDAGFDDRQVRVWEAIEKRIGESSMPPKGMPQPDPSARKEMVDWISRNIETARLRPAPKNGLVRRLTLAQYRNTLRELLQLEDDVTAGLPPDAVSKDGFVNNQETLHLSPLLLESYFDIADQALSRVIVDPKQKPSIQDFRVDLGEGVNPDPIKEQLVLGAGSALLENRDVLVTQPTPVKPFAFDRRMMKTDWRFIEGYQGNDTVRGWREYHSIYHNVFADMRGSGGYPKGKAYSTVPQGLLLRPAIPNDEKFDADGTYGPKANFKISTRELPDNGRFRVTVTAARYNDGLLLEPGAALPSKVAAGAVTARNPESPQTVTIPKAGVYQVDVNVAAQRPASPKPDASRLTEALQGYWPFDGPSPMPLGKLEGEAHLVDSALGQSLTLGGEKDAFVVEPADAPKLGAGEFTISAWVRPFELRRSGIVARRNAGQVCGWAFELTDEKGGFRIETFGTNDLPNGSVNSPRGLIRAGAWQHVAAVVRRSDPIVAKRLDAVLYLDGVPVSKGQIDSEVIDNLKAPLRIGHIGEGAAFRGDIDEVRIYTRALGEAEIQALVEPGRRFAQAPPAEKTREVTLDLGDRRFAGAVQQPAFLAVRLEAGPLRVSARNGGVTPLESVVFTPLAPDAETARAFAAFEKRVPRLGVHMGFRRDCGSTFAPVGAPQNVAGGQLKRYVFEGAIRNYPNPEVEKDNVNYLAGMREIAVRSEYTDGRDMPRLMIRSVEFEGPLYDSWPPRPHRAIFIDSPHKAEPAAYARDIVHSFATRAYRRPATDREVSALMEVYSKSAASGRPFQEAVKDTLQVVLTSPQFLFLVENSATPDPEPLDNYELASKLSYFLWNSPPDETTLKLAAAGTLRSKLDSEVDRMVADPKFSRFTHEFASQWLSLDKFTVLEPDKMRYPRLTHDTRIQLREEPIQLVEYLIRNNLPVRNLVRSDFVVANETVAGYYGLGDKTESGLAFVPIAHSRPELGGLLTNAAIMAGLSDGRESNPVKRGAWLARKIIAEPPADPPPNVPALKDNSSLTLRQRLEAHRSQPGCMQCHSKIDPWGVAMEEFDAGGRLKKEKADAHSTLPDKTEISGANDLKRYLSEDRLDQVAYSVLRHLATYGSGRTLTYSELDFLKRDSARLKADGYRMKDMVRYVASSRMFLEK